MNGRPGGARGWWVAGFELEPPDLLELFGGATGEERFFIAQPAEDRAFLGLGEAAAIEVEGDGRFETAARAARALFAELAAARPRDAGAAGAAPPRFRLAGGFAFSPGPPPEGPWHAYGAGRLVLPELAIEVQSGRATCTWVRRAAPDATPERQLAGWRARLEGARPAPARAGAPDGAPARAPRYTLGPVRAHDDYRARVAAALHAIAAGDLEKVVLARQLRLFAHADLDPAALARALARRHPRCATFAVARGRQTFVGASPERLVRRSGERVETEAVAGTAPRGHSPEEDTRLGRELQESKKEQAEHASVVRALRDALLSSCRELEVPEAPELLRLEGIQHLSTPIRGRLREPRCAVELAGALHPAPSVAGAPQRAALDWLARSESLERGWYAGPVGWLEPSGDGEFWVALRSALLRGPEARLYAGAGIVAGSLPEAELRETRLKLQALLEPLLEV